MTRYKISPAIRLLLIVQAILLVSCYGKKKDPFSYEIERAEAYVPVYGTDSLRRTIKAALPRPTEQAGKIYVFGNYLFQVEKNLGVHVIDYSDRKNPKKLGFVHSYGCSEVAYKDGYLVVNNMEDLVTIDITDLHNVKEAARVRGAFPHFMDETLRPPANGVFYVCPDMAKGDVIGWKLEKKVKGAFCSNP